MKVERQLSFIAIPNRFVYQSVYHKATIISGYLTSTYYTAVGSGFDPQGVPAEKPRTLLNHPPSHIVGLLGLLLQCGSMYLGHQTVH